MGKDVGIYHRFSIKKNTYLVIYEPIRNQYYWICIYLERKYRGKGLSDLLIDAALDALVGNHHIYLFQEIYTLKNIAKKKKWKYKGKSKYFDNCHYYFINVKKNNINNTYTGIRHSQLKSLPELKSFVSIKSAKEIMMQIWEDSRNVSEL